MSAGQAFAVTVSRDLVQGLSTSLVPSKCFCGDSVDLAA